MSSIWTRRSAAEKNPPLENEKEEGKKPARHLKRSRKDKSRRRKFYVGGSVFVLLLGLGLVGFLILRDRHVGKARETLQKDAAAGIRTRVISVTPSAPDRHIVLTGESRPFETVTLYAKLTGYLTDIKVDKGDEVKKDQILAIVSSPETAQQYQGAAADAWNKRGIAKRMKILRGRNLISDQEADQAVSDARVADSRQQTLAVQKGYQILQAPFDGTVTARFVDPGSLVQNSSSPVVTVSQIKRLRVYAYVNQSDAFSVFPGVPAVISLSERPDVQLKASVTRTASELDPQTRMMLAEVDLDNSKGEIVAGSFVQVELDVRTPVYLEIPVEALVQRGDKLYVPIVDEGNTIHYQQVTTADNNGQTVKILSGLKEGENVALNLGDSVNDGSKIRPIQEKTPSQPAE